jgi:hypothetical protein
MRGSETNESRMWIVAGATSATVRGDCQTCEEDFPYRHGPGILANAGYRVNPRMDVGAEIFWVPLETASGTLNTTHMDAVRTVSSVADARLLHQGRRRYGLHPQLGRCDRTRGDQLQGIVGSRWGGWAFRVEKRVGFQLFASQHAGALGDLQTAAGDVPDVLGNYWSVGAALVFR